MIRENQEIDPNSGVEVNLKELIALQVFARELMLPLTMPLKNHWVGGHISSMRGRGMDFEEVRVYSPGDDVRTMDWRVTARTNTPHVKVYHEERERPVFLVVDCSSTMHFGTKVAFKSVIAAKMAALLAWATDFSGDRIGAVLFSEKEEINFKPTSRANGVLPILSGLTKLSQQAQGDGGGVVTMDKVLARLRRVAPTGSIIFILSDFAHFDDAIVQQIKHLTLRHQLIAGFVYDPLEAELPNIGVCQFTNGNENLVLNSASQDTRHRYQEQFYVRMDEVREIITRSGQSFFQIATNQAILPVLQEVLRRTGEVK